MLYKFGDLGKAPRKIPRKHPRKLAARILGPLNPLNISTKFPLLPFLVFLEFLVFFPCEEFLVFLSVFPFFSRDFRGSAGIKNPCFFGGFPGNFPKKQGKERQGCSRTVFTGQDSAAQQGPQISVENPLLGARQVSSALRQQSSCCSLLDLETNLPNLQCH